MSHYNWTREQTYDFVRENVMKYCGTIPTIEQQIRYLEYVLLEKRNRPPDLDENLGLKPTFEKFVKHEIKYRKFLMKFTDKQTAGITKITGRVSDIVRIFEAMKRSEIISFKTEATQIGRIFFSEKADIKNFELSYNARKKEIRDEERCTSSEPLLKFVNDIIETNFRGKPEKLDLISDHIKKMN